MDAEGYPAQCAAGAGKGRVSTSVKKNMSWHFCRLGSDVKNSRQSLFRGFAGSFCYRTFSN